jgi:hypothetical protein
MASIVKYVRHATKTYASHASKKYPGISRKGVAGLIKLKRKNFAGAKGIRAIKLSHAVYPRKGY